jgi:XTP/dITP diphosphohydrolase
MESNKCSASDAFQRLSDILDTLRKECPWDRKQTMKSLRYLTIEEVHELSEAIVAQSPNDMKKELGDVAMHILFYCKIAEEEGLFSTADVYNTICEKLVSRHPFIYDKENYHGESWEQLKTRESDHRHVLDGVPDSLPSMVKAVRMQEKVAGKTTGSPDGDLGIRPAEPLPDNMDERELGDRLFALVDWARRHGINADDALSLANRRFAESISGNAQ